MVSDSKERILSSTIYFLKDGTGIKGITARNIAEHANVNPAMINYYYGSKENLIVSAMKSVLLSNFEELPFDSIRNPKQALGDLLVLFSDKITNFKGLLHVAVPRILMDDEITFSNYVYPYVKAHYKNSMSDSECKLIAYRLVSFLLLIVYRADEVMHYCSLDVSNKDSLREIIHKEVNLALI